jgi:hypothetical protein
MIFMNLVCYQISHGWPIFVSQNPNVIHFNSLLEAELAAMQGKQFVAKEKYEVAILMSGRRGLLHDTAVAHERFSGYYLELGDTENASYHMNMAVKGYEEWGALAKVNHVKEKYPEYFRPPTEINVDA